MKLADLHADQDSLRRKNEELVQAYKEKSRKQMQTQELYDKLKRRAMLGQVQDAASEAVDDSIHASAVGSRFTDRLMDENVQPRQPPVYSGLRTTRHEPIEMISAENRVRSNNVFSSQDSHHGDFLLFPL